MARNWISARLNGWSDAAACFGTGQIGVRGVEIRPFDTSNRQYISQAAKLLADCFPQAYADCGEQEMMNILGEDHIVMMAVEKGQLIGFAGAMPQYGVTGWELHPLVVHPDFRRKGIGTRLVAALEQAVAQKGGITMYLGTDDEFGQTSLSNTDLYVDTYAKIESIQNLGQHPFEFYQKIGYKIVGVIPDANGIGKPDIWMAKRIGTQK